MRASEGHRAELETYAARCRQRGNSDPLTALLMALKTMALEGDFTNETAARRVPEQLDKPPAGQPPKLHVLGADGQWEVSRQRVSAEMSPGDRLTPPSPELVEGFIRTYTERADGTSRDRRRIYELYELADQHARREKERLRREAERRGDRQPTVSELRSRLKSTEDDLAKTTRSRDRAQGKAQRADQALAAATRHRDSLIETIDRINESQAQDREQLRAQLSRAHQEMTQRRSEADRLHGEIANRDRAAALDRERIAELEAQLAALARTAGVRADSAPDMLAEQEKLVTTEDLALSAQALDRRFVRRVSRQVQRVTKDIDVFLDAAIDLDRLVDFDAAVSQDKYSGSDPLLDRNLGLNEMMGRYLHSPSGGSYDESDVPQHAGLLANLVALDQELQAVRDYAVDLAFALSVVARRSEQPVIREHELIAPVIFFSQNFNATFGRVRRIVAKVESDWRGDWLKLLFTADKWRATRNAFISARAEAFVKLREVQANLDEIAGYQEPDLEAIHRYMEKDLGFPQWEPIRSRDDRPSRTAWRTAATVVLAGSLQLLGVISLRLADGALAGGDGGLWVPILVFLVVVASAARLALGRGVGGASYLALPLGVFFFESGFVIGSFSQLGVPATLLNIATRGGCWLLAALSVVASIRALGAFNVKVRRNNMRDRRDDRTWLWGRRRSGVAAGGSASG